jgi:hypothetical protein
MRRLLAEALFIEVSLFSLVGVACGAIVRLILLLEQAQ